MKAFYITDLWYIVKKLLVVLGLLFIIRVVFFITNHTVYSDFSSWVIFKAFIYSVRFDVATLLIYNSWILIIAAFFPRFISNHFKIFGVLFNLINLLLLFFFICDNIFFAYTQRRITYDLFRLIPQSFTPDLLFTYIVSFWYWVLLFIASAIVLLKTWSKHPDSIQLKRIGTGVAVTRGVIVVALCSMCIRGFEARPLSPSTVLLYFHPRLITLIPNTGFNLLYSFYKGQKELDDKQFFQPAELDKRFSIYHTLADNDTSKRPNIVLFVMESFARDYLTPGSAYKAKTPFLDSIMERSLVFTNAFDNGNESTHGLVALLAGLPPFMQQPFYHSQYHSNNIRGIGELLGSRGYDCSFFLGDVDDSFGFKEFTRSLGIPHYYSMEDFGNDELYNGAWGIHDEYFFSFAADVLTKKPSPFFSVIYNVSSHPPYIIPQERKKQFTIPGQSAAQNSISYVDFSYKCFFEKIRKEKWYGNTIFIFIADHFFPPSTAMPPHLVRYNEIPFFIYSPSGSIPVKKDSSVTQQLDVLPSILQLSGYNGNYMSFGESVFNKETAGYAVQKMGAAFQIIDSSYVLGISAESDSVIYCYNYRADPELKDNLVGKVYLEMEDFLKAIIQRYNYSVRYNRLYY